jgi:uncharacterized integral membrane protein
MPWRLLGFILLFAIFLAFIGFNLENNCNISFGFIHFSQVPVYLTVLASFVFGMFCTIPFLVPLLLKRHQKAAKTKGKENEHTTIDASQPASKKSNKKAKNIEAEINQGDYGIN